MSSQEKNRKPGRSRDKHDDDEAPISGEDLSRSPFRSSSADAKGPRIWVLPTATGNAWAIAEEVELKRLSEQLCEKPPTVLSMRVAKEEQPEALRFAGESVQGKFQERSVDGTFALISRLVISAGWLAVAFLGLRIPGEVKFFDEIMLLSGTAFLAYTVFGYALPLKRWKAQSADAVAAFPNGHWQHSTLLDRVASAIKLRKELKVEERGKSPDAELLDANAYRKLIRDGVCSAEELSALGLAIEQSMKLKTVDNEPRKIAEVARECRIDLDSAIFYRDLAAAAADIRLDQLGV